MKVHVKDRTTPHFGLPPRDSGRINIPCRAKSDFGKQPHPQTWAVTADSGWEGPRWLIAVISSCELDSRQAGRKRCCSPDKTTRLMSCVMATAQRLLQRPRLPPPSHQCVKRPQTLPPISTGLCHRSPRLRPSSQPVFYALLSTDLGKVSKDLIRGATHKVFRAKSGYWTGKIQPWPC